MNLSHVSDVRNNGAIELVRQKADGEELADARNPCGVDLDEVNGPSFEKIFEHHTIRHMLTESDAHGSDCLSQLAMGRDVVRMRRLFDPIGRDVAEAGCTFPALGAKSIADSRPA